MKFDIPENWSRKWARLEAEDSGSTVPVNPGFIARWMATAMRKRYEETHDESNKDNTP